MKPSLIPIQSIFCISEGYAARPTMPPNEHKLPSVYIEENRLLARLCARAPPYASTHSDLDDRDSNYWQMLLWDHQKRQLIGGQRMLFATPGVQLTQSHSYLEHCYPSLSKRLLQEGESYAEVGRTFVAPRYQCGSWLKELIRGFFRIPEAKGINLVLGLISFNHLCLNPVVVDQFIAALESSLFRGNIRLPQARFPYNHCPGERHESCWDGRRLLPLQIQLKLVDQAFSLPPVLRPYRALCSVKYEGATVAKTYNNIIQLLFSGRPGLIKRHQRRRLEAYPGL
jgi:hypothetical protein